MPEIITPKEIENRGQHVNKLIVDGINNYGAKKRINADKFFQEKLGYKTLTNFLTYKDITNGMKNFKLSELEVFLEFFLEEDTLVIIEYFARDRFNIQKDEAPIYEEFTKSELILKVNELNGICSGLVLRREDKWADTIVKLLKEMNGVLVSFENKLESERSKLSIND